MRFSVIVFLFSILFSLQATAQVDEERNKKLTQLIEAQGLIALWQDQIEVSRKEARKQSDQMLKKLTANIIPDKISKAKFRASTEAFIKKINTPWVINDLVGVWIKYFGDALSNDELDKMIAYYNSDIGKKDVTSRRKAAMGFIMHMQREVGPLLNSSIQRYFREIQSTVRLCNCPK